MDIEKAIDIEDLTHEDLLDGESITVSDEENVEVDIEICDLPKDTNYKMAQFDDIYKENKEFGKFIEKCLQLDDYQGMLRVIIKTLIPLYKNTPDDFKVSLLFKKCLNSAFCNLENDPEHKFSHVKNVCETLKRYITKKKVPFVTLEKSLKNKTNIEDIDHLRKRRKKIYKHHNTNKRLTQNNVLKSNLSDANIIDLDAEEFEVPIVNLDDPINITSEPIEIDDDKENSDDIPTSECIDDKVDVLADNSYNLKNSKEMYIEIDTNDCEIIVDDNKQDNYLIPDKTLVPKSFNENSEENRILHNSPSLQEKIQSIEQQIADYKSVISYLEELEVTADTQESPYVRCEKYKAIIVQLYKELCRLIGEEPVKRREVRLRPANPRSQLPIKKLEEFINRNIGSDGLPHFPDFSEVVLCVTEANNEGGLGWSKKEIVAEARALFTYCGQALQQSRQRREWRDLMRLVKIEVDHDPAESDPELFAKLEENKLRAKAKETEILEKFSNMGEKNDYAFQANNGENDDLDSEEDTGSENEELESNNVGMTTYNEISKNISSVQDTHQNTKDDADSINERHSNTNVNECEQSEYVSSTTQQDQLDPESISQGDVTTTTDDSDIGLKIVSVVSIAKNQSNTHKEILDRISKSDTSPIEVIGIEIDDAEDYTHYENDAMNVTESINEIDAVNNITNDSNSQLKELLCNDVNTDSNKEGVDNNHNNYNEILQCKNLRVKVEKLEDIALCEEIKIKEEPKSNLLNDLDELGDTFTTTILDIEDPFLVIEISSDSSSDDDTEQDSYVET